MLQILFLFLGMKLSICIFLYCQSLSRKFSTTLSLFLSYMCGAFISGILTVRNKDILWFSEIIAASNYQIHATDDFPFYATQIIDPFLNSRIPANHDKVNWFSANWEILIKAQGYLERKISKCVYLSLFKITKLFLKSESLLL